MPWDPIVYKLQYTLLTLLASLFWLVDRAVLFVTLMVYAIKSFIIDTTSGDGGFVMQTLNNLLTGNQALQTLVILAAGLALLAFSLSRILRPILETNPVDPGRVLLWLAVFSMLLTLGSSFFIDLEQGRDQIRSIASEAVIGANSSSGNFTPAGIPGNLPNQMRAPRHFPFMGGSGCAVPPCADGDASNGLDLALAFLFVSAEDEVATMSGGDSAHQYMPLDFTQRSAEYNPSNPPDDPTPEDGYGGYFYWDTAHTDLANNDQRQAAVDRAVQGVVRMLAGIPVCLFALLEALIYLAFTIAAAVLFISVPVAMIFAFFKSTEVVMVGLVRSYVALYAKTFAVTGLLTLFFSFLLWFANAGNWGAFMAICIVMLLFSFQFLGLAFGTVKGSLDTLTASIATALGSPASARQGLSEARAVAATGLAAAGQGASLAAGGGAMLGRVALGAIGGPLGLAVGAAGLVAGRQTAARLSGLTAGRFARRAPPGSAGGASSARVNGAGSGARPAGNGAPNGASERNGALGRIGAADGALVRNGRSGRRAGAAVGRALDQVGDRAAVQRELARSDLRLADRDALAELIDERPQEARAVLGAVEETLAEQPDLSYLNNGRLDPASAGMTAVLDRLQGRLPAEEVARLRDDVAGQSELRLLVGSRLGIERKFGRAELQGGIALAAGGGGGVQELTAGLGVAPHAFGASHAAVDHFVRELGELGLTSEEDVRNALILARDVKRQSPNGDFSQASRARAVKGKLPALGHFERKLGLAAGRAALAAGYTDPRDAELRIQRLLRDALDVPTTLYAQVLPEVMVTVPPAAIDAPTTVMPPVETQPLDQAAGQPGSQPRVPAAHPIRQRETGRTGVPATVRLVEPEDIAADGTGDPIDLDGPAVSSTRAAPDGYASAVDGAAPPSNGRGPRRSGSSRRGERRAPQVAPLPGASFPLLAPTEDRINTPPDQEGPALVPAGEASPVAVRAPADDSGPGANDQEDAGAVGWQWPEFDQDDAVRAEIAGAGDQVTAAATISPGAGEMGESAEADTRKEQVE